MASISICYCITIECDFEELEWAVGKLYSCSPAIIRKDRNLTHVLSVIMSHKHLSRRRNDDVEGLWVTQYQVHLKQIPKDMDKFFPNLLAIGLQNTTITSLTADDFKPFPHLELLTVLSNKLVSIDGDIFKYTPNMRFIEFSDNLLQTVGLGLLDNLEDLNWAHFSNNQCIDFDASDQTDIRELRQKLRYQCSSSVTTPNLEKCSFGCSKLINDLKAEVSRQGSDIEVQNQEIVKLRSKIERQKKEISMQAEEISDIQKAVDSLEQHIYR